MFDTMEVAKKIKEARIAQNLTQLALADEMGVSYQAVSNWERGNSMPDISKLEELCRILRIGIDELLSSNEKGAAVIEKVLSEGENPLTLIELGEVAQMLPPDEVQSQVESVQKQEERVNLSELVQIIPFLDEEYLGKMMENVVVDRIEAVCASAPFLDEKTLNRLMGDVVPESLFELVAVAPFLSEECLEKLVYRCKDVSDGKIIGSIAPFVSQECIDFLVEKNLDSEDLELVCDITAPFMGRKTARKVAEKLMEDKKFEALQKIVPFM